MEVPCGQCKDCRLARSSEWAIRCMHEAQLYEENCFITLTYKETPPGGALRHSDFQLFMKRLRKARSPETIRYFMCGEYGAKLSRPHYHACLFNCSFPDQEIFKVRKNVKLYTSQELSGLWKHGYSTVGDLTFETAAYTARYIMKKVTGEKADGHYHPGGAGDDASDSERVPPEYCKSSTRRKHKQFGGIGSGWFERYHGDVFPHDFIVLRGRKYKVPRYYDKMYEALDPDGFAAIKEKREKAARRRYGSDKHERREAREKITASRVTRLIRGYENEP